MDLISDINFITVIMLLIFAMPLLTGILNPLSGSRVHHSLRSVLGILKFFLGFAITISLMKAVFSDRGNGFSFFRLIPSFEELIARYNHDIVAYFIIFFVVMVIVFFLLGLLAIPLDKYLITPLINQFLSALKGMRPSIQRIFSGLWQLPRAIWMVLIFSMLLNFYSNYVNHPTANNYINSSEAYLAVKKTVLTPILSADIINRIPMLMYDSLIKTPEDDIPSHTGDPKVPNYWNLPAIKYFNGVTIDEAVKSNTEIDNKAKQIVGAETADQEKALLLYQWICKNIQYDNDKAAVILQHPSRVDSGSIVTFEQRKGICFDYSCLYVSMCRATGIKVRLISGLGYSGTEWGEHVWNQVYDPEKDRWLNVDTTFGNSGFNYFDNADFSLNHKYDVIQAEW